MKLSSRELVNVLMSEQKMEEYIRDCEGNSRKLDPIIWQIHFSVPARKRMRVLNEVFKRFLSNMKMLYCFIPPNMVLAKVYNSLKVPYRILSNNRSQISNNINIKKFPKDHLVNKYRFYYNTLSRKTAPSTSGMYDFVDEIPSKYISYGLFRAILKLSRSIGSKSRKNAPDNIRRKSSETASTHVVRKPSTTVQRQSLRKNFISKKNISPAKSNISTKTNHIFPSSLTNGVGKEHTEEVVEISNTNENIVERTELISSTITHLDTAKLMESLTSSSSEINTISEISDVPKLENAISNTQDFSVKKGRMNENLEITLISSPNGKQQDETCNYSDTCKQNHETREDNFDEVIECVIQTDRKGAACELVNSLKPKVDSHSTHETEKYSRNEFRIDDDSVNGSNYMSENSQISSLEASQIFSKFENCTVVISSSERKIESVTSSDDDITEKINNRAIESNIIDSFAGKDSETPVQKIFSEASAENELIDELSKSPEELRIAASEPNNESVLELIKDRSPKPNHGLELHAENKSVEEFSKSLEETRNIAREQNNIFDLNKERSQSVELDFETAENIQLSKISSSITETGVDAENTYSLSPQFNDLKRSLPEETLKEPISPDSLDTVLAYDSNSDISNCVEVSHDVNETTVVKESESSVSSLGESSVVFKSRQTGLRKKKWNFLDESESSLSDWMPLNLKATPKIISSDSEIIEAQSISDLSFVRSEPRSLRPAEVMDSSTSQKSQSCGSMSIIDSPMKRKLYMPNDFHDYSKSSRSKSSVLKGSKVVQELPAQRTRKWILENFGTVSSSPSSSEIFIENKLRPRICDAQKKRRLNLYKMNEKKKTKKMTRKLTQYKHHKILKDSSRFNKINEAKLSGLDKGKQCKNIGNLSKMTPENGPQKERLSNSNLKKKTFSQIINKSIDDDGFSDSFSSSCALTNELGQLSLNRNASFKFVESDKATVSATPESPVESNWELDLDNTENICESEEIDFDDLNLDYVEEILKRIPRLKEGDSNEKSDSLLDKQKFDQHIDSDTSEEIFRDYHNQHSLQKNLKKSVEKGGRIKSTFLNSQSDKTSQNQRLKSTNLSNSRPSSTVSSSIKQAKKADVGRSVLLNNDDDEYGSDELTFELNTNLNLWHNRKDASEANETNESVVSRTFDADINQLLTEYATLNSEQKAVPSTSHKYYETCSSTSGNGTSKINLDEKSPCSKRCNFNEIVWDSYPDSMETALSTPDEKLEQVRGNLKKLLTETGNTQLLEQLRKRESSKDSDTDVANFSDW